MPEIRDSRTTSNVEDILRNVSMNGTIDDLEENRDTPEYMLLPKLIFKLSLNEHRNDIELKRKLLEGIERNGMTCCYEEVCRAFDWPLDENLHNEMQRANAATWERLESPPFDTHFDVHARKNWREKVEYAMKCGNYERAYDVASSVYSDEAALFSSRTEAAFNLFRVAYLTNNVLEMARAIENIKALVEGPCNSGSDWYYRNKLKAYEAIYCLAMRNFVEAAKLFLDCVPTFESYELLRFKDVIRYAVLSGMVSFERSEIDTKFCKNGIIQQALTSQCPKYKEYMSSLFDCCYATFFKNLAWIERKIKSDPLLRPHYRHYVREMRIRGYSQILQAYRILSFTRMAKEFDVNERYIEQEVAKFIANGRLHCKIDKISEVVMTVNVAGCDRERAMNEAPDACRSRGHVYKSAVKNGDALLNRLKKLAQVIDF